jgi:hypothetical protein
MDIQEILFSPFAGGLALGLLIVFFTWKSGFAARKILKRDLDRAGEEARMLQNHLNTQLKINAEGNESLQGKLEALREQNENLRVNVAELQQKPGRAELRQLTIFQTAVGLMREQAPGFAQAWEKATRQAELEYQSSEGGLKKLVRKVLPTLGTAGIHLEEDKSPAGETRNEGNKEAPLAS